MAIDSLFRNSLESENCLSIPAVPARTVSSVESTASAATVLLAGTLWRSIFIKSNLDILNINDAIQVGVIILLFFILLLFPNERIVIPNRYTLSIPSLTHAHTSSKLIKLSLCVLVLVDWQI